ncbi:LPXTG cell wall anchor domain-containing protein, partial [Enterococcus malodoratus]
SSTKPSSSSTEESSSTKPSSSSTEESSSTKPSSSGTGGTSSSTVDSSENSDKKEPTNDSKGKIGGNGTPNTPAGGNGAKAGNASVRNYSVNEASESSKKELPKTGNSSNYLLIWCGVLLIIGSIALMRKTNIVRK